MVIQAKQDDITLNLNLELISPHLIFIVKLQNHCLRRGKKKKRLVLKPQDTKHTALRTVWEGPTPHQF